MGVCGVTNLNTMNKWERLILGIEPSAKERLEDEIEQNHHDTFEVEHPDYQNQTERRYYAEQLEK